VWPQCVFRMQVWNVLHAARWKYSTQQIAKNSPSRHQRTICRAVSSQLRHLWTIGKSLLNSNLPHVSLQYGELRLTNGWDLLASLGHPSIFQLVSRLGFVIAASSLNGGQPNFTRRLAVSCSGTLYTHFWGLLPPDGILPCGKFTLRPILAFSNIGSVTARHSSSGRQRQFAASYKEWNYGTFAEGATCIRLMGGHHVGHRPIFYSWEWLETNLSLSYIKQNSRVILLCPEFIFLKHTKAFCIFTRRPAMLFLHVCPIRPVLEYGCVVWRAQSNLCSEQSTGDSPHACSIRIILHPLTLPFSTVLAYCDAESLNYEE